MLRWRVAISVILIPLLFGIFYLDARLGSTAPFLLALTLLLGVRGSWELADLFRERATGLNLPAVYVCVTGILLAGWLPHFQNESLDRIELTPMAVAMTLSILLLGALATARFSKPGRQIETLAMELLIVCYIGILLGMTTQLRWVAGSEAGYLVLGSVLVCTKGGDIGGYFVGKRLGRRKLAPVLSPAKTLEGLVGAVIAAAIAGWLWLQFATPIILRGAEPPAWPYAMIYGAFLGLAGAIGDLCESLFKRDVGRKDSAALFPGFGGLLDILDSVLFAGPVALLIWKVLPLATWLDS